MTSVNIRVRSGWVSLAGVEKEAPRVVDGAVEIRTIIKIFDGTIVAMAVGDKIFELCKELNIKPEEVSQMSHSTVRVGDDILVTVCICSKIE